jgi:hypothetical protein
MVLFDEKIPTCLSSRDYYMACLLDHFEIKACLFRSFYRLILDLFYD